MPRKIRIRAGGVELDAELFDTACAQDIFRALPIDTPFNTWGDEFYFEIPVALGLDDTATSSVKAGDIGYWPTGSALAIFFGPTPMSSGADPVPASDVNIVGKIVGDATLLKGAMGAGTIRIEKSDNR